MSEQADRTAVGKIGRMPADIRREVCRRLADNEPAASVIGWIETQPAARATLDEHFDGAKVLPQNLSEWKRNPEFMRYCKQRDAVANAKGFCEFSLDMAKASGGISSGSVAVIGGKIMQMLEDADPAAATALVDSVNKLRAREQKDQDLALKKRRADQVDRTLALAEKQFQARTAELFLKWYGDKRVQDIVDGKAEKSVKIDQLRLALFGDEPKGLDFGQ
ncbi:MAG TPA: hypothetical protein PLG22_07350 [Kiritimatiellia bacterium]|nr:hypothetical protein [Kiritimatiellia bacterium]